MGFLTTSSVNSSQTLPYEPFFQVSAIAEEESVPSTNTPEIIAYALGTGYIPFGADSPLGNDFPSPFEFGGLHYSCATAAYEAQKFSHRNKLMEQFTALNATQAFALSAEKHLEKHLDWNSMREGTMYHVLRAKFGQNRSLKQLLLSTFDAHLSFHTPFKEMDPFWTDDSDGSGANRLGRLLMQIRNEYGGFGETPPPANYRDLIPENTTVTKPIDPLDKTPSEELEEINQLNESMSEEDYRLHSQIARLEKNRKFTRFPSNNFPYDATLVPLSSGNFINASFVLGHKFIATQSPLPHTTEDFWSMVLEHDVPVVIMLNRIGDEGDEIYFPFGLNDQKNYGRIHLELMEKPLFTTDPSWRQAPHEEEPHAIIHRKLKIWRDKEEPRCVDHFQYQNWRDFSIGNVRAVAHLVRIVDAIRTEKKGLPIAIHCHAGVGRTSTMITLLDQFKHLSMGTIDIKRSVERQRSPTEGRCYSMMQSIDQYTFCYRVLRELLTRQ